MSGNLESYENKGTKEIGLVITCGLYPLYTGAATFVPPLCDHKTGQVAVEGRREAERLPWSFKGGT